MKFSPEQEKIINAPFKRNVKGVIAYAGCGKSTTLKALARKRQGMSILYLAFNKSIVLEAKKGFPKTVDCKTLNSMAYKELPDHYKERLGSEDPKGEHFAHLFGDIKKGPSNEMARVAIATIALKIFDAWCNSSSQGISPKCVRAESAEGLLYFGIDPAEGPSLAVRIFREMNSEHSDAPISHSFYVKRFHLKSPKLPYDVIMVDEAQDLNPVLVSILEIQTHAEQILVGDGFQSIYGFRDCINALATYPDEFYHLTATYRFGSNLATQVSHILVNLMGAEKPMVGRGQDVIIDDVGHPDRRKHITNPLYIARTKAGILELLISVLIDLPPDEPHKIYMPGGSASYGFSALIDAYSLYKNGIGRNTTENYESFEQYEQMGEAVGDQEITTACALVRRMGGRIPACIIKLKECEVKKTKDATMSITTAHKSKGLEYDYVVLLDDFPKYEGCDPRDAQEVNLLYVAATRAMRMLDTNQSYKQLLRKESLEVIQTT